MTAAIEEAAAELLSGDKAADPLIPSKKRKFDDAGSLFTRIAKLQAFFRWHSSSLAQRGKVFQVSSQGLAQGAVVQNTVA